ncbi:MAG: hypothetical protein SFV52_13000 [Saprospiraceae bacterium]|nr:hypothetical protein [Saprospiraceae bacterium]
MVGSAVGFATANSKVTTNDVEEEGLTAQQLNIAPAIGYFVIDNLALGLGVDWTLNNVTEPNDDETDDSNVLFGPFIRYYFPLGENVAAFGVANFGFGNSSNTAVVGGISEEINTNLFAFGVGPGLTVYTKGGFGIEAIFKYNYAQSEFDTEINQIKASTETRTNQFAISLGMQYYFGGFRRIGG